MATARRAPTQARAARTRAALLEAARTEFSEKGYAATTARSIAVRAGAATGSFYQYFTDKDEVLRELCTQRLEPLRAWIADFDPGPELDGAPPGAERIRKRLGAIVQLVMDLHTDDPGFHAVLTEREHADPRLAAISDSLIDQLIELIARVLQAWGYSGDRGARAFLIYGLIEGSVHAHVLGKARISDRRFKRDLVTAVHTLIV